MRKLVFVLTLLFVITFTISLSAQEAKQKPVSGSEKNIELIVNGNQVFVRNAESGQLLEIYSVVGLKVDEIVMKSSPSEYVLNVPKGYYILKIGDVVRKVAIK